MISSRNRETWQKWTAFVTMACLLLPLMVMTMPTPASAQIFGGGGRAPQRPGMSTGKKVALLGGAALLYFLYRKHQANKQAQVAQSGRGTANNGRMPQLYRSKNGGIYYRDANARPVWLTAPQQQMQVSAQDIQRYAPDYQQYNGPAPAAPQGYRVQRFDQFDPSLFGGETAARGGGGGSAVPPGPRGY